MAVSRMRQNIDKQQNQYTPLARARSQSGPLLHRGTQPARIYTILACLVALRQPALVIYGGGIANPWLACVVIAQPSKLRHTWHHDLHGA